MSDFHCAQTVKARKSHRCEQCRTHIEPGESYLRIAGNSGDFYFYKVHPECDAAAAQFAKEAGLYGDEWPWLWDDGHYQECAEWFDEHHPVVAERLKRKAAA